MVYLDASRLISQLVISTTRTPVPFGGFAQGVGLIDRIPIADKLKLKAVIHPSLDNDWFRRQSGNTVFETRRLKADVGYILPDALAIGCIATIPLI